MNRLEAEAAGALGALTDLGLRRTIQPAQGIDFASNDTLGLRMDPRVLEAAAAALREQGVGAGAARLLRGDHPAHRALEEEFRAFAGAEDALLFSSGYLANLGVLETLGTEGWTILSDARNHASLIAGCRAARAHVQVISHNDVDAFARAIRSDRTIVVTEAVFSVAGDRWPTAALGRLCAERGAALIVDEAHAIGVFGPEEPETPEQPADCATLRVFPCGKALAGAGAVVTGPRDVLDLLRSRCRTFLFTTAPPPVVCAAVLAAFQIARAEPWRAERAVALAQRICPTAESPIVLVPCKHNQHALARQEALRDRGMDVRAVRPPTLPEAALRLSLHADRTDEEVALLATALAETA